MTIEELMRVELAFEWMPDSAMHNVRGTDADMKTIAYRASHGGHEVILVVGDFPVEAFWHIYLDRRLAMSTDGLPAGWKIVKRCPARPGLGQLWIPCSCYAIAAAVVGLVVYLILRLNRN